MGPFQNPYTLLFFLQRKLQQRKPTELASEVVIVNDKGSEGSKSTTESQVEDSVKGKGQTKVCGILIESENFKSVGNE